MTASRVTFRTDGYGGRTWCYTPPRWLRRFPSKAISDHCQPGNGPMLIRFSLLRTPWGNVYLHHFIRSDYDRHLHDHPWNFATLLLTGGYYEHVPAQTCIAADGSIAPNAVIDLDTQTARVWRRRFSLLRRPATWRHWVEIVVPVWTLVFVSVRRREWGFWTERGWIDWMTYGKEWCE